MDWWKGRLQYWLYVGNSLGSNDLLDEDRGTNLNATVPGLPTDGRTLYVRLYSLIAGAWQANDYTYTATTGTTALAELITPPAGSTLAASTVGFHWTGGTGVSQYWLYVGNSVGGSDLFNQDRGTNLNATVVGLPTDGRTLYVRLYSLIGGAWHSNDYTYTATAGPTALAALTTPAPESTLTASTVELQWTGGTGVSQYWLYVGNSVGGSDLFDQDRGTNLNATIVGLPTDGRTLYVRLYSLTGGAWQSRDYTYIAPNGLAVPGELTSPAPGSMLTASTVEFQWTGGMGVSYYVLYVGTSEASSDLFGQTFSDLKGTVPSLPTDGRTLYVRLWSGMTDGTTKFNDYVYTATTGSTALAELTTPAPGSTLTTSTVEIHWTGGTGVSEYVLYIGNSVGGGDLFAQSLGTNLNTTLAGLPTDGRTLYVRLWSRIGTDYHSKDYIYTATTRTMAPAELTSPAPQSTLTASRIAFQWTGGAGGYLYFVFVGNSPGSCDFYCSYVGTLNNGRRAPHRWTHVVRASLDIFYRWIVTPHRLHVDGRNRLCGASGTDKSTSRINVAGSVDDVLLDQWNERYTGPGWKRDSPAGPTCFLARTRARTRMQR